MPEATQPELPGAPKMPALVRLCEKAMNAKEAIREAQRTWRGHKAKAIAAMKEANQLEVALKLPTGEIVPAKWKHKPESDDLLFGKPRIESKSRKKKGA